MSPIGVSCCREAPRAAINATESMEADWLRADPDPAGLRNGSCGCFIVFSGRISVEEDALVKARGAVGVELTSVGAMRYMSDRAFEVIAAASPNGAGTNNQSS